MSKINTGVLHDYANGEIVTEQMLDTDHEIIRVAINDTNDMVTNHQTAAVLDHPNGSVTTAKLADASVTAAKIADSNVTTTKIADSNVTTAKIADGAVTEIKIANSAVTTNKIADGSITALKMATGALDSRYYTKTQLDAGQLDTRYYTEAEVDTALAANASGDHTGTWQGNQPTAFYTKVQLDAGGLDGRYYTEAEVDSALSANASGNHTGTWQGHQSSEYYTKLELDSATRNHAGTWQGHNSSEYYTKTEIDSATRDHKGTWRGYTPEQLQGGGGGGKTQLGVFYVSDYASQAVDVGLSTEDWQPAIQACIDAAAAYQTSTSGVIVNQVSKVLFDRKRYKIRKPIMVPAMGMTLEGLGYSSMLPDIEYDYNNPFDPNMINCTVIEKTTTTTWGAKTRTMRGGSVTDNYNVDAIIMVDHLDENWAYNVTIRGLYLRSRTASGYGIYAPRLAVAKFEDIMIYKSPIGFFTYDTWQAKLSNVKVREATTAGFRWASDTGSTATGTSVHFENCFADTCAIGYDLQILHYTTLTCCAADHCTVACYKLYGCDGITMNGCGAEDTQPNTDIFDLGISTFLTVNGFGTYDLDGSTSGTHAVINCTGNGVSAVFNACKFVNYNAGVNTTYTKNYIVSQSCIVTFNACLLPSNGGTGTVGANSMVHVYDTTGYKQITSTGTKTAQMV